MTFPDTFSTERLRAERLTPEHLAEVRRMHRDPVVMAHLGGVRDATETAAYLERNLEHWASFNFGLWILYVAGRDAPVGRAMLRHLTVEGVDEVEVGYAFYAGYWSRGLATEVTAACLRLARECLALRTIVAVTSPDNVASQHVLQKSGLAFERDLLNEGKPSRLFRVRWADVESGHPRSTT